jgi:hypothetical protein
MNGNSAEVNNSRMWLLLQAPEIPRALSRCSSWLTMRLSTISVFFESIITIITPNSGRLRILRRLAYTTGHRHWF